MIKTLEHKKTNCCFSTFTDGTERSPLLTFQRKKKCQGTQHPQENFTYIRAKGWWMDGNGMKLLQDRLGQSI
jgi:hypothetical protein